MNRIFFLSLLAISLTTATSFAIDPQDAIRKSEAIFEPASAKPGETVTLKVTLKLADGWQTYPTEQVDKAAKGQTNRFTWPTPEVVIFVGKVTEPGSPKTKSEPALGIEELRYYPGGGVWERKTVVSPKAPVGEQSIEVKFRVLICDKDTCFPPKTLILKAPLKVLAGSVAVDAKYAAEVEKALDKK